MATKLQQMRIKNGLTQAELAEKANLNLRTLQYYEQGNKPIESARLDKLLRLCVVLKCRIDDIMEDSDLNELYNLYEEKGAV